MDIIEKIRGEKELVFLVVIFLISFIAKMYFLTQDYLIAGMDAGYYVNNINLVLAGESLDTGGSPPVIFYYAAFLTLIFGDVMVGYKIGIALLSAAIVFPLYLITKYLMKDGKVALFAAFLGAFSSANMRIMVDLLKNTGGLFFGAFFLYYFIKLLDEQSRKNIVLTVFFFGMMLLTHFSSTAYITASIAPFLVIYPIYDFFKKKKLSKASLVCLISLVLLICATLLMAVLVPGLMDETSIGTVGLQELRPGQEAVSFSMFEQYGIFSVLIFLGLYELSKKDRRHLILFAGAILIAFLLTQPLFVEHGWLWRFILMSYVVICPVSAAGAFYFREKKVLYGIIAIFAVYTLWGFVDMGKEFRPLINEGEYLGLLELHSRIPDAVIFGPRGGIAYWFEATGFNVSDGQPDFSGNVYFVHEESGGMRTLGGPPQKSPNIEELLEQGGEFFAKVGRFTFIKMTGFEPLDILGECGDGICSPNEKCSSCPEDCPCDLPERPICAPKAPHADIRGCVAPK